MSIRSRLMPHVAAHLCSQTRLDRKRLAEEKKRIRWGEPHKLEVFHNPADPYSQLLMQILPDIQARYDVEILTHIIGPPADGAVPERALLAAYAKDDAAALAKKAGIDFTFTPTPTAKDTEAADAHMAELSHYQGGTIYYAGEWYWGLDRLHYLEDRLTALSARTNATDRSLIFSPPKILTSETLTSSEKTTPRGLDLHWYFSFRSPYSAISADRVIALATQYGANLKLRFVRPMVMRGLPVPKSKRSYILQDTAREARRLGVPFGKICDPLGAPVERGYAILHWAMEQDAYQTKAVNFARCFLSHVWAKGVDANTDRGLKQIVEAAGLPWADAKAALENEAWRAATETNRAEMVSLGIWGVPSFRVGETIVWGQDRMWRIEEALSESVVE